MNTDIKTIIKHRIKEVYSINYDYDLKDYISTEGRLRYGGKILDDTLVIIETVVGNRNVVVTVTINHNNQ
jgi:hypothetical protein